MIAQVKYASLKDRSVVILGFGSIGVAALPLLLRHFDITPAQIRIITADGSNRAVAVAAEVAYEELHLNSQNYREILGPRLRNGDILLNLTVDVSCYDLIELCAALDVLYLDTSNEIWPDSSEPSITTTFGRRSRALERAKRFSGGPTALVYHGANPGLVSHFARRAVLDMAARNGLTPASTPTTRTEWALLARDLGVVALHISEMDSQRSSMDRRPGEFVNTWSVDGFIQEFREPAGFAWGSHEHSIDCDSLQLSVENFKCRVAEFARPGSSLEIRSWIPGSGIFHGYLVAHPEAFSIAELFSLQSDDGRILYQPTVHFAYRPCSDAIVSMNDAVAAEWAFPPNKRVLAHDIVQGMDELGVLVLRRNDPEVYWYGSRLDIAEARRLVPTSNATSLQVAAGVLAGLVWIIENPCVGFVEPEKVDFERALEIAAPYLGTLAGYSSSWAPMDAQAPVAPQWRFPELAVSSL